MANCKLAINDGKVIPYSRQWVDEDDIEAVVDVLRSDWLTAGPKVDEFESVFADSAGTEQAVAVSSGTAALHAAMYAIGIGPGDEVIVPPMTFAATANCVVFQGGTPVFADVQPDTLLLDPVQVEARITSRTRAIIAVDYAGHPCDYDALRDIANRHKLPLVADACHALGGSYKGRTVGSLGDLNVFSFHPVKHITSGEGGIVTTNSSELSRRMRIFRNHGITSDHRQRARQKSWYYEMVALGYNYRLTDFQCALSMSQLRKLPSWLARRREIAERYDAAFDKSPFLEPLSVREHVCHARHLYVVQLKLTELRLTRAEVFARLHGSGVRVNVHYIPVHLHPFYRNRFGTGPGLCLVAEAAYERILSLPLFPMMNSADLDYVLRAVLRVVAEAAR